MDPWDALRAELNRWEADGEPVTFWWRDDDAVRRTPRYDRLLALSARFSVPVSVAVIPRDAEPSLAMQPADDRYVTFLQHGYAHTDHAASGGSSEFAAERPLQDSLRDVVRGRERLEQLFPKRFLPVFVPPWNSVSSAVCERLDECGLSGLSVIGPRWNTPAGPNTDVVNVHCDVLQWSTPPKFVQEPRALQQLTSHLIARRISDDDRAEPTGLMTHHLAMDEASWSFCERLFDFLTPHVRWLDAKALFARAARGDS